MDIKGRTVLITGGASGIGKALATEFAYQEADLFLADIDEERLDHTCKQIETIGRQCKSKTADVSRKEQVKAMVDSAIMQLGHIDILINNAGVTVVSEVKDKSIEDWEWIIGINLWGPIYGVHYVLPHMIKRKSGHIVNMASIGGLTAVPGNGSYNVTKFGLVGFSEALRAELKSYNIGVTLICPGFMSCSTTFEKNARVRGFTRYKPGDFAKGKVLPVEDAARKFVRAIKKEKFLVTTGLIGPTYFYIKRFWPWLYYRIGDRMASDLEKWK
jgi:short-subunit dehydrogenase